MEYIFFLNHEILQESVKEAKKYLLYKELTLGAFVINVIIGLVIGISFSKLAKYIDKLMSSNKLLIKKCHRWIRIRLSSKLSFLPPFFTSSHPYLFLTFTSSSSLSPFFILTSELPLLILSLSLPFPTSLYH